MTESQKGSDGRVTVSSMMQEIQGLKDKFKSDEDVMFSPFHGLEKAAVLQECRIFNDASQVTSNPRRCCQLITKLLHILTQGDKFSSAESTEVFFGVTKLFQSTDANLRRMMYLFIKEVAEATAADEVIIVTSSLTKDMNTKEDLYRANAIRVLCKIIDTSMLGAIERYIKQAIVDSNQLVASSALVSGIHLMKTNPDIVRRWVNEVQEALKSPSEMVTFHALSLMHQIRSHDRLAVSKLVSQLSRGNLRSPLGTCLLIRYTSLLLNEDMNSTNARAAYAFLESSLRHKSDMVIYEAARAICNLPGVEARDLSPAITVLQLLMANSKPTLRFAAVRTLNKVAMVHPAAVMRCNDDMEALISDSNRSIATLAITTLLKTGNENSVDRLMKQISNFMGDIADEFKVVVVDAIRALCIKYPAKQRVLMAFLSNILRDEGGYDLKKCIVDSILDLTEKHPETKTLGLLHLCEFIEDCEFTQLSTQILHVLGKQGPLSPDAARYIRFIYNRVILENAVVRACAVSALAQFGAVLEHLRPSVLVMLRQSLHDDDDEVRDVATLVVHVLSSNDPALIRGVLLEGLPMSHSQLLKSINTYQLRPTVAAGQPLTLDSLPIVAEDEVPVAPKDSMMRETLGGGGLAPAVSSSSVSSSTEDAAAALYKIPEFASLGALFRSSRPVELTESETEYVVSCIKHVFAEHVVLQYNVTNTLQDQQLNNVTVNVEMSESGVYEVEAVVPCAKLPFQHPGVTYVCLRRVEGEGAYTNVSLACELKFTLVEVDSSGVADEQGFEEEYALEDVELGASDYMAKITVNDFREAWEAMGDEGEVMEKFALSFKSLPEAVTGVINFLGMQPCEATAQPQPKAKVHMLLLSGVFLGGTRVLARCQIGNNGQQCVLKIGVRSDNAEISQIVADCIQ